MCDENSLIAVILTYRRTDSVRITTAGSGALDGDEKQTNFLFFKSGNYCSSINSVQNGLQKWVRLK